MLRITLFAIALSWLFIGGCKKCDCPEPPLSGTLTSKMKPGSEGKDAMVFSTSPAFAGPNDSRLFLMAGTWSGIPGVTRAFIQFDYSSIPKHATINSALLTLYADTTDVGILYYPNGHSDHDGPNDWYINRITANWSEGSVTWNNQPITDGVGQVNVPGTSNPKQTFTVDITDLVKDEFENPGKYFGIMMRLETEGYYRGIMFCSTDHPNSARHPELEITYTVK
jgi:hypothetical protein